MTHEAWFSIASTLVLPAWGMLIFGPRWIWTRRLIHSGGVSLLLGLVYFGFLIRFANSGAGGGFGSLAEVSLLFRSEDALLAGWVHYLAFDLFIGAWEVRDAQRHGLPHGWIIPCLFFTFMAGPVGLLLYWGIRSVFVSRLKAKMSSG